MVVYIIGDADGPALQVTVALTCHVIVTEIHERSASYCLHLTGTEVALRLIGTRDCSPCLYIMKELHVQCNAYLKSGLKT